MMSNICEFVGCDLLAECLFDSVIVSFKYRPEIRTSIVRMKSSRMPICFDSAESTDDSSIATLSVTHGERVVSKLRGWGH